MTTLRQLNFAAGELAPALQARVDQSRYAAGLRTCRNAVVMHHGGLQNRPGTELVAEVKTSSTEVRLIPFVFNASQTYVLEFGNLYMRVHAAGAQILEATQAITGITQANPGVVTIVGHGYSNGEEVNISGVVGMTELNGRNFVVAGVTADTFTLQYKDNAAAVNTTAFTAYSSGGTAARVYEIVTPYTEAQLFDLRYVQSADVVTIVHPSHAPRDLARTADTSWTLTTITFAPTIAAPANLAVSGVAGTAAQWVVTTTAQETFEESLATAPVGADSVPDPDAPRTLTWDAVAGAQEYNVYRVRNGIYGFIGTAGATSFVDDGIDPDTTDSPPIDRNPFSGGENPATVTYHQQRQLYANTPSDPETVFASQTGLRRNFTLSLPLKDDDAVTFSLQGREVNAVRHLIEVTGQLLLFTAGGEWTVDGDERGILLADAVNPQQHTYNGAHAQMAPLNVGGNALYVQARGSIVRDLAFSIAADGYQGNDLTIFSAHLFEGYTISDWAYSQQPNSIVWIVRSDGALLGLTYVREQGIVGWHRHDSPAGTGVFESVCAVPEDEEDAVYVVVQRTISGVTRRYIERFASRQVGTTAAPIEDAIIGMDSVLTFDGRNTDTSHTMTLSGGTTWGHEEELTLTSSEAFFVAGDVGNEIHFTAAAAGDGYPLRCEILTYTSPTVVTARPHRTVPTGLRGVATSGWARAVDEIIGLEHLNGEDVSVFADGFVVASPNNGSYDTVSVTLDGARRGTITLDKPYGLVHVGLPYVTDIETLDIDVWGGDGAGGAGTIVDNQKLVNRVTVLVEASRGLWVGGAAPAADTGSAATTGLREAKIRGRHDVAENLDDPVALLTGKIEIQIDGAWNSNGRVFLRQVDPLPLSVLTVAPSVIVG